MLEIIVPLHNNGHFLMICVILLSQDRNHGGVFIYKYLGKGEDESNLISKMRWAKFFGIFYQKQALLKDNVYMGVKDMSLVGFNQGNHCEKPYFKS